MVIARKAKVESIIIIIIISQLNYSFPVVLPVREHAYYLVMPSATQPSIFDLEVNKNQLAW